MQLLFQRLSTWLCLLVALAQAGSAHHGVIVCLEPGGDVNLEATLDGERCGECPAAAKLGGEAQGARLVGSPVCCPCVDIALDLWPDGTRAQRASAERQLLARASVPAPVLVEWPTPTRLALVVAVGEEREAVAPALVGSVVLRV